MNKAVKGIQTINRFIKLLNGMPEKVRQSFYRSMAAKIKLMDLDNGELKKYHIHIYKVSGKLELSTLSMSEEGARSGALEIAEKQLFSFGKSDCKYIAKAFLIEEDGESMLREKVLGEIEESIENQPRRKRLFIRADDFVEVKAVKEEDYSGAKITHRPPDRKPADFYDKK